MFGSEDFQVINVEANGDCFYACIRESFATFTFPSLLYLLHNTTFTLLDILRVSYNENASDSQGLQSTGRKIHPIYR